MVRPGICRGLGFLFLLFNQLSQDSWGERLWVSNDPTARFI
jgi:hypothetical protein